MVIRNNRFGIGNNLTLDPSTLEQIGNANIPDRFQETQGNGSSRRRRISCRDLDSLSQIEQTEIQDDRASGREGVSRIIGDGLTTTIRDSLTTIGRTVGGGRLIGTPIIPRDTLEEIEDRLRENPPPTTTITEPQPPPREDSLNSLDSGEDDDPRDIPGQFLSSPFLGLGKAVTIIDIENYADSYQRISQQYGIERSILNDHIKYYNGSFYVLRNDSLVFYRNISDRKKYITLGSSFIAEKGILTSGSRETYRFSFDRDLRGINNAFTYQFKQRFATGGSFTGTIKGQNKDNFNFQGIIGQQNNIIDNSFMMQYPFENSELLDTLNLVGTSIVDIKQQYRFYIEEYEKIANSVNETSQENVFPNLYVLNAIIEDKTNEKQFLSSIANMNDRIRSGERFLLNKSEKTIFGIKDGIGEYFDLFGINYESLRQQSGGAVHDSFANKMQNIVFLSDTSAKMAEISKKKYLFPMSVDFSIPTDKTTNVTRMLLDAELMDSFMMQLLSLYKNNQFDSKETAISERIYSQKIEPSTQQNVVDSSYSSKRKTIKYENISKMLEDIKQQPLQPSGPDYVVIGDTTKYLRTNQESMSFVNGLRNIIFNSKLNTFVRKNHRTYKDILNGRMCYNETVAFRVAKYDANGTTPIQNYWIPNNPDLDYIDLIDTQVKYEKEYTYKIFAYQFVLGNKITQSLSSATTANTQFAVNITNLPQASLMEVEILSSNKMVADTPPLSPEILFVPYFDVDNKIGLFLNSRTGEEKLEPINILATDEEKTSKYKKMLDNTVLYKSDDVASRFEIMKLDRKPNSYADFASGFVKAVSTDIDPETPQKATAASHIDTIEPNKKYYYCFRAVDVHEKISNPTQVFEFEMLNEKGMIYPIIKNYEFEKPAYQNNIEMRRFIKIKPSSQHTFINSNTSGIQEDTTAEQSLPKIKLGVSDVAVPWGKKFKMVVTSKQTGKKCEFKFIMKYKTE